MEINNHYTDDLLSITSMGAFESDGNTIFCRFCGEVKLGKAFEHHEDCLYQAAVKALASISARRDKQGRYHE